MSELGNGSGAESNASPQLVSGASGLLAARLSAVRRSRFKHWLYRVAAVLLGLSFFVAVELVCVAFNLGPDPEDIDDPFVGFNAVHPLFVRVDDDGGKPARFEIPKVRRKFFAPESFPATKARDTFRVFCFGGSTVQGRPFSKETSFTTWLRLSLTAADSSRNWEVVNCGGVSYASYRLVPILKECLNYEPDLFIICTGHNEFLEERTYGEIKRAPELIAKMHANLSRLRSYSLLRSELLRLKSIESTADKNPKFSLPAEVDAFLDYRNGLDAYHRDDTWHAGVVAHFDLNVRNMLTVARRANVPVILIKPPSNLSDCPPFKSENRSGLTTDELRQFQSLVTEARSHYKDDLPESVALLNRATAIDSQFAAVHYELGKCYETMNDFSKARKAFLAARECDICPLRILKPMEQSLNSISDEFDVPLIDAHELLEQLSPNGILGDFLLVDHIHPSFRGHQMIADELTKEIERQGRIRCGGDWKSERKTAYDQHFARLDDLYFLRGQRMLEILGLWTKGRADGPELSSRQKVRKAIPQ